MDNIEEMKAKAEAIKIGYKLAEETSKKLNNPKPDESRLLTDECIYELNEADTEQRKRFFWESGVLDTCKAIAKAQLIKDMQYESILEQKYQERVERIYELLNNNFDEVADLFAGYDNEAQRQIRESFSGFGKLISSWLREKTLKKQEGIDESREDKPCH